MSTGQRLLFFLTAWLIILMPFLFWWKTWFGRRLPDNELVEYLNDEKKPRHIQHALVQIGERMSKHDASVDSLVSRTCTAGNIPCRRSPQHRRLGHGARHIRRWLPRNSTQNAQRRFSHGSRKCRIVPWYASAMPAAKRRLSACFSRQSSPLPKPERSPIPAGWYCHASRRSRS